VNKGRIVDISLFVPSGFISIAYW